MGEQFKRFYFAPKVPFLDDPERQKIYRKGLIKEISRLPEPEPLYLMADKMHLDLLETIGDRSNPETTREDLSKFYLRRTAQLQHKKYKLLIRWANASITSPDLDNMHRQIDKSVAILQQETDMCNQRLERLIPDDKYTGAEKAERPSPTTQVKHQPSDAKEMEQMNEAQQEAYKEETTRLYIEKSQSRSVNSAIRQDDFEVYLRQKTYNRKLNRLSNKLVSKIKWLPLSKRFDMWQECREMIYERRQEAIKEHSKLLQSIQLTIKQKLERFGEQDEKAIVAVTERYIFHLKEDAFVSRMEQILQSYKTDVKRPFMIFASNFELKLNIERLAAEYPTLSTHQMDIDNGQQFSYQMQSLFPLQFEKQVILAQFEIEDSGKDPDRQLLERLIKNLGLSRFQVLQEIEKYSEQMRKNSILGALSYETQLRQAEDASLENAERAANENQFSEQNLIRKIKTIEFFSLNELKVKLRNADWLEYVCFEPNISETQKQQNHLLSSDDNQIDNLLKSAFDAADVHDQVSINKVMEEAAQAHIQKVTAMQTKVIQGELQPNKHISGREANSKGLVASLKAATKPESLRHEEQEASADIMKAQFKRYEHIQNIDQLNVSLVKNYYSLRLLKSREYKHKLLSLVNYFRAVQRILALDLKEHVTREKAVGDRGDLIEPHFGRDGDGKIISKQTHQTGPGKIFAININRKMDADEHDAKEHDPVTINCYKYNGKFDSHVLSTCPMLPKYHRTFGRPNLYESMRQEVDRKTGRSYYYEEMRSLIVKRDKILLLEERKEVKVYNELGQPIVYSEALTDMVALEEELIKIGSYFINQHEYIQASNDIEVAQASDENKIGASLNARPSSMIDRFEISHDLLGVELDYQFAKVKLVEKLLESYEHIYDPLESVRCLQMIVDTMAQRPRINTEASLYTDSYEAETKLVLEKLRFYTDLISLQTDIEKAENRQSFKFQEMKVSRVAEAVCEEFKLEEIVKSKRVGCEEANPDQVSEEQFKIEQAIQAKLETEQLKKDQMLQIQKRHITEYANEQYSNFATVLGLPEINMEDLVAKRDQREPIIQDAVREQAFFTKQLEGYPTYFSREKYAGQAMGLRVGKIGTLDFFESLTVVPKINASLYQAFEQLSDALKPENGLAMSLLELCLMREARMKLLEQRQIHENGDQDTEIRGLNHIEDDFYLGNSDKVVLTMKEFKAEVDPENLYKTADPLVVSKLDMLSVSHYNFPRINMAEVRQALKDSDLVSQLGEDQADAQLIKRMIELAKNSAARQLLEKTDQVGKKNDYDADILAANEDDKTVRSPSLLKMACNLLEALRIREELIERASECQVLTEIYKQQYKTAGKSQSVNHPEPVNFNTSTIMKDQVNIIDLNHGRNKAFDLPFMEFDPCLSANLDLKSESCIKSLMTELGVEELRAILHYQIMQQNLLTTAVLTNQFVIDGPAKGLKELLLLENAISVPNPVLKLTSIISSTSDITNIPALKSERQRLNQTYSKCTDCFFNVLAKKERDRGCVSKKFHKLQTTLMQNSEMLPEMALRILRSYRVKLLHEYCSNVLDEVYIDSMKVQTLQTCNQLRLKASLLPPAESNQLFTVGEGCVMENLSAFAQHQLIKESIGQRRNVQVKDILSGQIIDVSLFYIPHSEEILMTDRVVVEQMQERQQRWVEQIETKAMDIDKHIKAMVARPTRLDESFQPGLSHLQEMQGQAAHKKNIVLPTNRVNGPVHQQQPQQAGQNQKRAEENRFQMYKFEKKSKRKYGFRKVNFMEALNYSGRPILRLLEYLTLILRIFTLEYYMGRNNTPGHMMLEMEQKILTGREFWTAIERAKVKEDLNTLRHGSHSEEIKQHLQEQETATDRVIDKILQRKTVWQELSDEMRNVKNRVQRTNRLIKNLPHDRRTITHLLDLLVLQHQATFYTFLNGMENILEIYRDKGQDEQFYKVLNVRDQAIKRRQGMIMSVKNGFYVSQAAVHPGHMSLRASDHNEFAQFMQQYHPIVDERALIPKQVNMMQRVYGMASDIDTLSRDCLLDGWMCNYANLQSAFFNLPDSSRSFIGSNFQQLDELIDDYLIYKGIMEMPKPAGASITLVGGTSSPDSRANSGAPQTKPYVRGMNFTSEYLLASVEVLSFKIEMAHMQRVLMSWISGEGKLPETTAKYMKIMRKYQEITTLRTLRERDLLNDAYFHGNRNEQTEETKQMNAERNSASAQKRDRQIVLDANLRKTAKFAYFDKVNLVRAETNIIKRLLDIKLIHLATRMIANEHSALTAAIDFTNNGDIIQRFVHPQQQFASTLFQDVDRLPHLDVVNKLGFVQQFLTRLRNRCTEVDTLTSGPGIVFSMKDFNECLSIFCKQALKYSEENLRQRVETSAIMQNQYRHLIYLKEMEKVYYRAKCEQFLRNIDVIVDSKMSAKGNAMIYELDVTNRELRTLKDHYYLMERYMREEIKKEFTMQLSVQGNQINQLTEKFKTYKTNMNHELQEECEGEINFLDSGALKALRNGEAAFKAFVVEYSKPAFMRKGYAADSKAEAAGDGSGAANYKLILQLEKYIRKYKAMTLMKNVITEEKHQREIKELQLKLTLNSSLWEQLCESQKREQITRQELELTRRNLTHYEKLIERLYVQLEQLNNEKIRLQRYKSSKQKKISELESKMKDLEILENIDLDKILTEMRLRDKKIERLQSVDDEFQIRMDNQERQAQHKIQSFERMLQAEREAKHEAYAKLESMRIEMKALEGTDIKNDLWKDKCKELYEISKELEVENDGLRAGLKQLQVDKGELTKFNEQLINQHKSLMHLHEGTEATLADTHLMSSMSRHNITQVAGGVPPNLRENMILNRNKLTKPLTAKTSKYGQKRTQSGNPIAARNANRLFQRNMTNAQSYNYERGAIVDTMQQTLPLSNTTSYPGFSSDVDVGSIGVKHGLASTKVQNYKGGSGGVAITQDYQLGQQYRSNQANQKVASVGANRHNAGGPAYAQSTRQMGLAGTLPGSSNAHGVLSSNVITQSGKNTSSGMQLGSVPTSGTQLAPIGSANNKGQPGRLHTSHGGRGAGSRSRVMNVMRAQPTHGQMGVVGNTMQNGTAYNFADRTDTTTSKQMIALSSGSEQRMNIEQVEYQMREEMKNLLQNSSAAVHMPPHQPEDFHESNK